MDIADGGGDLVDVTSTATVGGILIVNNAGATLEEGHQFTIVSAPSVGGAFDLENSVLPELPSGLVWIGLYGEYDASSPGEEAVLRISRVGISGNETVDEGSPYTLNFVVPDPNLIVDEWRVDWGDGSEEVVYAGTETQALHTYADGPENYTITVTATINDEESPAGSLPVTVLNVDPAIDLLDLDSYIINEDGSVALSGAFTDPGSHFYLVNLQTGLPELVTEESHIVTIDWGDGSANTVIELNNEERTFGASHQYLDDDPSNTSSDDDHRDCHR